MGIIHKNESSLDGVAIHIFLFVFNFLGMVLCGLCLNSIFGYCGDVYEKSRGCIEKLNHSETL